MPELDGALIAAELELDGVGDVNAAELLYIVISNAGVEHVPPGIRKGLEDVGHVGADGLAFRARRSIVGAAVEFCLHFPGKGFRV